MQENICPIMPTGLTGVNPSQAECFELTNERLKRAIAALQNGNPHISIDLLESLLQSEIDDDDDINALVYLGIAYVQAELPEKAVDILQRVEEMTEEDSIVSMFLGRALRILKRYDEAEEHLRRSIRLDSSQPDPWIDLGWILYSRTLYGDAAWALENAVGLFSDSLELRGLLALCYYRLGDFASGAHQWAEMHRIEPTLMSAISNYAYLMLIQNRPYEAAPFVGRAITIAPDDYRSLILLGELRLQSGEHEGARECLSRVLKDDPENVEALSGLGVLAHHMCNYEASREYLELAESLVNDETSSWRGLCYAYSRMGKTSSFLDCLVRWVRADPGAAAPWVELAVEYDKQSLLEHSRNAWRVVFELRHYVKITCGMCSAHLRKIYNPVEGFDIYQDVICEKCGALIPMPAGLSSV